jgi:hypothetical protein
MSVLDGPASAASQQAGSSFAENDGMAATAGELSSVWSADQWQDTALRGVAAQETLSLSMVLPSRCCSALDVRGVSRTVSISSTTGGVLVGLLMVFGGLCGCQQTPTGPQKYPVVGTVTINGEAAHRVAVTFHHQDAAHPGNLRFATGMTDSNGRFALSCEGDRDGAIGGEYRVTFAWMSSGELDAFDMLGGTYSKPDQSEFRVTVPSAADAELSFDLSVSESGIRRPGEPRRAPTGSS